MQAISLSLRFSAALQVAIGVFVLFLCAQVTIPLNPVPVTLQTLGVLLIALTYEKNKAVATISSYIILGLMGAPVFAGYHNGIQVFTGMTGGFVIGFWFAVYIVASLKAKFENNSFLGLLAMGLIAQAAIYFFGVGWIAYFIGIQKAISVGFMPFIIPGLIKTVLLVAVIRSLNYQINKFL